MKELNDLSEILPSSLACSAMGVSRASLHRFNQSQIKPAKPRVDRRALNPQQREEVLNHPNSDRFAEMAPASVYATLLDEGVRLCSIRTMYRLLHAVKSVRERRDQRRHVVYEKPQLMAEQPNHVWSWDITKLLGPQKWEYFHLYVMMDIYSRKVVGWMVCPNESGSLAQELIEHCYQSEEIVPGQLSIHSDRGTSMTSKPVVQLLQTLDVHKSLSRPHVSNDNPFSEAHFKTLKYRPSFPRKFGSLQDAKAHLRPFFAWYNDQHRHSSLGYMTPASVHDGSAAALRDKRQVVLDAAYALHPERFVRGRPIAPPLPTAAWINPPAPVDASATNLDPQVQGQEVPNTLLQ
jgi:putative transposase